MSLSNDDILIVAESLVVSARGGQLDFNSLIDETERGLQARNPNWQGQLTPAMLVEAILSDGSRRLQVNVSHSNPTIHSRVHVAHQ